MADPIGCLISFCQVLKLIKDTSDTFEKNKDECNELSNRISDFIKPLELMRTDANNEGLVSATLPTKLNDIIKECEKFIQKFRAEGWWRNLVNVASALSINRNIKDLNQQLTQVLIDLTYLNQRHTPREVQRNIAVANTQGISIVINVAAFPQELVHDLVSKLVNSTLCKILSGRALTYYDDDNASLEKTETLPVDPTTSVTHRRLSVRNRNILRNLSQGKILSYDENHVSVGDSCASLSDKSAISSSAKTYDDNDDSHLTGIKLGDGTVCTNDANNFHQSVLVLPSQSEISPCCPLESLNSHNYESNIHSRNSRVPEIADTVRTSKSTISASVLSSSLDGENQCSNSAATIISSQSCDINTLRQCGHHYSHSNQNHGISDDKHIINYDDGHDNLTVSSIRSPPIDVSSKMPTSIKSSLVSSLIAKFENHFITLVRHISPSRKRLSNCNSNANSSHSTTSKSTASSTTVDAITSYGIDSKLNNYVDDNEHYGNWEQSPFKIQYELNKSANIASTPTTDMTFAAHSPTSPTFTDGSSSTISPSSTASNAITNTNHRRTLEERDVEEIINLFSTLPRPKQMKLMKKLAEIMATPKNTNVKLSISNLEQNGLNVQENRANRGNNQKRAIDSARTRTLSHCAATNPLVTKPRSRSPAVCDTSTCATSTTVHTFDGFDSDGEND